jgi:hypothetical protein
MRGPAKPVFSTKPMRSFDRAGTVSTVLRVLGHGVIFGVPGIGFT